MPIFSPQDIYSRHPFVDDTNLIHLNMDHEESVYEAYEAIQLSITNWGDLFMTSGGSLKPITIKYLTGEAMEDENMPRINSTKNSTSESQFRGLKWC